MWYYDRICEKQNSLYYKVLFCFCCHQTVVLDNKFPLVKWNLVLVHVMNRCLCCWLVRLWRLNSCTLTYSKIWSVVFVAHVDNATQRSTLSGRCADWCKMARHIKFPSAFCHVTSMCHTRQYAWLQKNLYHNGSLIIMWSGLEDVVQSTTSDFTSPSMLK